MRATSLLLQVDLMAAADLAQLAAVGGVAPRRFCRQLPEALFQMASPIALMADLEPAEAVQLQQRAVVVEPMARELPELPQLVALGVLASHPT